MLATLHHRQVKAVEATARQREADATRREEAAALRVKEVEREAVQDRKVSRKMLVAAQNKAEADLRELRERHDAYVKWCTANNGAALDEAYLQRDQAVRRASSAEAARLAEKREADTKLREQRVAHSQAMAEQVAKERVGHEAVLGYTKQVHENEQKRLRSRLSDGSALIHDERAENAKRCVLHLRLFTHFKPRHMTFFWQSSRLLLKIFKLAPA